MREGIAAGIGASIGAVVGLYCWHIPDLFAHAHFDGVEYAGYRALFAYFGVMTLASVGGVGAVKAQEQIF